MGAKGRRSFLGKFKAVPTFNSGAPRSNVFNGLDGAARRKCGRLFLTNLSIGFSGLQPRRAKERGGKSGKPQKIKPMGAIKNTTRKVTFDYPLQDSEGSEFLLQVTATVEATFADENGGTYRPLVFIQSLAWTDAKGGYECSIEETALPIKMRASISAMAADYANTPEQ